MGVFLGQLPPAELARLKAELAETLIAHFCYPRFYDYRTESLRVRPVDRSKRQEVWLYLSSVDFTAWHAVDLMSVEFQHKVELLYIQFVQRNRSFFGEQGRKRMADIRMLIGSSAAAVVQGLRNHLTGHHRHTPPFGSPRPVMSWASKNVQGRKEIYWEQVAPSTLLLQQQLQESRGEVQSEAPPTATIARRPQGKAAPDNDGKRADANGIVATPLPVGPLSNASSHLNIPISPAPVEMQNGAPPTTPRKVVTHTTSPAAATGAPAKKREAAETPTMPIVMSVPQAKAPALAQPPATSQPAPQAKTATPLQSAMAPQSASQAKAVASVQSPSAPSPVTSPPAATQPRVESQRRDLPAAAPPAVPNQQERASAQLVEEDVAIFEQMRYQIILWLRIEALRSGIEVANQNPAQLLDFLRQKNSCDETGLQVASTLLNLANQVIHNGHANPLDYKQALLFHLMHTRQ